MQLGKSQSSLPDIEEANFCTELKSACPCLVYVPTILATLFNVISTTAWWTSCHIDWHAENRILCGLSYGSSKQMPGYRFTNISINLC